MAAKKKVKKSVKGKTATVKVKVDASAFGDAGSWSGSYGGNVSIQDLVRYAKTRGSILSPNSTLGEE